MNTHIRNKRADEVWWAEFTHSLHTSHDTAVKSADKALDYWASRFADEETLADIEANKARREMGNEL